MVPRVPSHETLLRHFRTRRGLYVLGAGTSAGHVPVSLGLLRGPALDYARGGSFPAAVPGQSELTRKSIATATGSNLSAALSLLFPDREVRPGTPQFPLEELLRRQSDGYTCLHIMHALAKPCFWNTQSDNYLAFSLFYPSVILNYNLDGLASSLCRSHKVITPHGTVNMGYGSPDMAKFLQVARGIDLTISPDDVTLCVSGSDTDWELRSMLWEAVERTPDFVAVIGYSFGRNRDAFDDHLSWRFFRRVFNNFQGNIYVIDPEPDDLSARISEVTRSNRVFGVPAYWNALAHAFMEVSGNQAGRRSLDHLYNQTIDTLGGKMIYLRRSPRQRNRFWLNMEAGLGGSWR